jgi:hypothetical protein
MILMQLLLNMVKPDIFNDDDDETLLLHVVNSETFIDDH